MRTKAVYKKKMRDKRDREAFPNSLASARAKQSPHVFAARGDERVKLDAQRGAELWRQIRGSARKKCEAHAATGPATAALTALGGSTLQRLARGVCGGASMFRCRLSQGENNKKSELGMRRYQGCTVPAGERAKINVIA